MELDAFIVVYYRKEKTETAKRRVFGFPITIVYRYWRTKNCSLRRTLVICSRVLYEILILWFPGIFKRYPLALVKVFFL